MMVPGIKQNFSEGRFFFLCEIFTHSTHIVFLSLGFPHSVRWLEYPILPKLKGSNRSIYCQVSFWVLIRTNQSPTSFGVGILRAQFIPECMCTFHLFLLEVTDTRSQEKELQMYPPLGEPTNFTGKVPDRKCFRCCKQCDLTTLTCYSSSRNIHRECMCYN